MYARSTQAGSGQRQEFFAIHPPCSFNRSFTLVELLVVVSIIALLISILLPSLKKARDQAKQVACAANLSGLAKANSIYGSEWNGWFVGSPASTGQYLYRIGGNSDKEDMAVDPVQIWDWSGPILAQSAKGQNPSRPDRWRGLIEGQFLCPSNAIDSSPFFQGRVGIIGGFRPQRMVSYNSMRGIMCRGGSGDSRSPFAAPQGSPANVADQYFREHVGGTEQPPIGYEPRIDRAGNASEKIFLADGARFTDIANQIVDHDISWNARAGGGFASEAPTTADNFFRSYFRSRVQPVHAKNAYRHQRAKQLGLNVSYFDGHAEWISESRSRFPDPWWPKDTVLPLNELNPESRSLVLNQITSQRPAWWPGQASPQLHYRVRR